MAEGSWAEPGERPALVVGLTGGIASGKSAAADAFRKLGVPVLDADVVAREVVAPGQPALREIAKAFGDAVIDADGALDRARLREIVFSSPEQRRVLEAITHPAVRQRMFEWLAQQARQPYAILEVPLLVETGLAAQVDRVLVIDVPEDLQMTRVMRRDGTNEVAARRILSAQVNREHRLAAADDTIDNTATLDALAAAVKALHTHYIALAQPQSN